MLYTSEQWHNQGSIQPASQKCVRHKNTSFFLEAIDIYSKWNFLQNVFDISVVCIQFLHPTNDSQFAVHSASHFFKQFYSYINGSNNEGN